MTFLTLKEDLKAIQSNLSFDSSLVPFLAALCQNREKVTQQFLSKWPSNAKRAKFDLFDLEKWPLERFNQIYLSICDLCHPKKASCQKNRKSYWSVSEIDPSPPSILTDGRTDRQTDGQTDRRTTDKSVLEKLRCLSAGGAKNSPPWR